MEGFVLFCFFFRKVGWVDIELDLGIGFRGFFRV